MSLSPTHARRARAWWPLRLAVVRLMLALAFVGALGACSDDDDNITGTADLSGTYDLVLLNGGSPTAQQAVGDIIISGNNWSLYYEDRFVILEDQGRLTRSGRNLTFSSTEFGDQFPGNVSGRRLTIDYNFADVGSQPDVIRMVFER